MSNGRLEFISERTRKKGIPSDPTDRCYRCGERAFQHDVLKSGAWGCKDEAIDRTVLLQPAAEQIVEQQIGKLAEMMNEARGQIVGAGREDEAEPGRMTIGEAVNRSKLQKMLGVSRWEALAERQRDRSNDYDSFVKKQASIEPVDLRPGPSKEDEFAACLGVPRAVIDELKVAIGEAEFDIWFAKRLSVKAAIVKQRLELMKVEARKAYTQQQELLKQQLSRQVQELGPRVIDRMNYLDGITGPQSVRKKPQQKASKPPAVLIGAPRRYFNEE